MTAKAVAASLMNLPTSVAGSRDLLSDDADHMPDASTPRINEAGRAFRHARQEREKAAGVVDWRGWWELAAERSPGDDRPRSELARLDREARPTGPLPAHLTPADLRGLVQVASDDQLLELPAADHVRPLADDDRAPILVDRQPVIREMSPGVWAFNGLASKGALLAPYYAERLAAMVMR